MRDRIRWLALTLAAPLLLAAKDKSSSSQGGSHPFGLGLTDAIAVILLLIVFTAVAWLGCWLVGHALCTWTPLGRVLERRRGPGPRHPGKYTKVFLGLVCASVAVAAWRLVAHG